MSRYDYQLRERRRMEQVTTLRREIHEVIRDAARRAAAMDVLSDWERKFLADMVKRNHDDSYRERQEYMKDYPNGRSYSRTRWVIRYGYSPRQEEKVMQLLARRSGVEAVELRSLIDAHRSGISSTQLESRVHASRHDATVGERR